MYRNEKLVGEAIRESGIDRSEIFVSEYDVLGFCISILICVHRLASKVAAEAAGYRSTTKIIDESLALTGLGASRTVLLAQKAELGGM